MHNIENAHETKRHHQSGQSVAQEDIKSFLGVGVRQSREEPMFIRALHGHSGKNMYISTFSFTRIEKGYIVLHIGVFKT